ASPERSAGEANQPMCAFVLLAGVKRYVPPEARVRVHGIWFGDRRHNARAASYSAEDLAVLQHELGLLAQYTIRMGGSINLIETAERVPPWKPLRLFSQEELRDMQLANSDRLFDDPAESVATIHCAQTALSSPKLRYAPHKHKWRTADLRWNRFSHPDIYVGGRASSR